MINKALEFATETALENASQCNGILYRDTHFKEQFTCYLIGPGLVVYEDDPKCVVSVEDYDGRFINA